MSGKLARIASHALHVFPILGLVGALLCAPAAEADRGDGTAEYEYAVTSYSYLGIGDLLATKSQTTCVPGLTAGWHGGVESNDVELAPLGALGEGSLTIGNRGSTGMVEAELPLANAFSATHELATACSQGSISDLTQTNCTDDEPTDVAVHGVITGAVGDRVRVIWDFRQQGAPGRMVPNYSCVEEFRFPIDDCRTKRTKLNLFTRKRFKLRFQCFAQKFGGAGIDVFSGESYIATATARGFLHLKRTKRR